MSKTSKMCELSRSSDCEVWKKEKEIMKIKVTKRLTYPETRKVYEQHKPEFTFSKIVQSMLAKPETKTTSTQYSETDCEITESTKVIVARKQKPNTSSQSSNSQKSASFKSSGKQIVPKNQNQPNNSKQQKQIASSRMPKGSEDRIQFNATTDLELLWMRCNGLR